MSGASDKARFYLEQSVPELKEYERKKIFSAPEINAIAKKRSDFEHKLNARGSSPSDYARYAEYEINVDALRRKRVKRLAIKAPAHNGQRRIFFILDRGNRKFPGDIVLWMQSIEYARKQKAHKKLSQILTNVLRLHPSKPDLWIYAAQFANDEHADITEARSYMQRGLRFCKSSKTLWLEYAKLEILYIAKIIARRHILGIDGTRRQSKSTNTLDDSDADMVHLPNLTGEDVNPSLRGPEDVDEVALQTLHSTPALTGAIPIAIFDAAMIHFHNDPSLGKAYYDLSAEFWQIPCQGKILQHIVETLMTFAQTSWESQACYVKVAVATLDVNSPDFPAAFGGALSRLKEAWSQIKDKDLLAKDVVSWLRIFLEKDDLDAALRTVISSKRRSLEQSFVEKVDGSDEDLGTEIVSTQALSR